jgi:acetolactate synthase-1/2/3 large subunit
MGEMNTAELLVRCLENEGVEYVFGLPGEENLHVLEALRHSSIQLLQPATNRGLPSWQTFMDD